MKDSILYNYKVCVRCVTYNHAPFIVDALNGFCMQETNFPYVCTIVDDASTDGEEEIIKRYLENNFDFHDYSIVWNEETDDFILTFAQHKTNKNCFFAVYFLKYNHYQKRKLKSPYFNEWASKAKYTAICEGDDYWVNRDKLQKQVTFLDNNPNYSMCFHNAKIGYSDTSEGISMFERVIDRDYYGTELFNQWIVPTASMMFISKVMDMQTIGDDRMRYGDIVFVLKCVKYGKVRGFSDEMSVYRIHTSSITHNSIIKKADLYKKANHYLFLKDNFGECVEKKVLNNKISYAYFNMFRFEKKCSLQSWKYLLLSLKYDYNVFLKELRKKFRF